MLPLTKDETDLAFRFANEFAEHTLGCPVDSAVCVWRSHDFPDQRLVLRIKCAAQDFALKIDIDSPKTGRLESEFDILTGLWTYLATNPTSKVIRPLYLSPSRKFFVTQFVDRPTAVDVIYDSEDDRKVAQVYRRAGAWLHDLHSFKKAEPQAFWPQWMMEAIRESSSTIKSYIRHDYRRMMNIMRADAVNLRGQEDIQVFSHGDFHGLNLILGQGEAIGLDFTEAREKLAVYDIVDFLKADVFRKGDVSEMDRSGILKRNKDMFFKLYRHPINPDILDFCIRGRLLRDWLKLNQADTVYSDFERRKAERLRIRLKQSMTETLT